MTLNIKIDNVIDAKNISGMNNTNINALESHFNCNIGIHGDSIMTSITNQEDASKLEDVFNLLLFMSKRSLNITPRDVLYVINVIEANKKNEYINFLTNRKPIGYSLHNKPIFAKTLKQNEYILALGKKDLIFSIGAAGTGKTYLAVCYAVSELKKGNIEKIILTRPAVEAGESLGFLPGDLKEKVDPYLRPL